MEIQFQGKRALVTGAGKGIQYLCVLVYIIKLIICYLIDINIVLAVFTFQDMLRYVIYSKSRCNFQITTGYYVSAKLDQIIF